VILSSQPEMMLNNLYILKVLPRVSLPVTTIGATMTTVSLFVDHKANELIMVAAAAVVVVAQLSDRLCGSLIFVFNISFR